MTSTKEKQLRKHKLIATGLFFLMALIYGLMVWLQHHLSAGWIGYVKAFSEAGMVGALADWFAVTALFRHPLGLPIPHTNLIRRKQKDLGDNLGKFVKENFLNPENIRPYIEKLDVVKIVADWLKKEHNREVLQQESFGLIKKIILDLEDSEVEEFLNKKSIELLQSVDYQKIASAGIHYMIENNEHNKLIDNLLPQIKNYVNESQQLIREKISENRPFIAFLAGKKISKDLIVGLEKFIEEIQNNPDHFVRKKIESGLDDFAEKLLISDEWNQKFDRLKTELINSENLQPYVHDLWLTIKQMLLENLEESDSMLKNYFDRNIQKLSENLSNDPELGKRINGWIRHFAYRMILKNRDEAEKLISSTVSQWKGDELSRKLELEVGKDLQWIRVNGTIVGGLVGLAIYTLTQLFIS